MKNVLTATIIGAFAAVVLAIETWLERRNMDSTHLLFLATIVAGMMALSAALILHFWRFA